MKQERLLLLSHTETSFQKFNAGLGEIGNAEKLHRLMQQEGYPVTDIADVHSICGEPFDQTYKEIARMNLDLADLGYEITHSGLKEIKEIYHRVESLSPSTILILSWNYYLAALFGAEIQTLCPTIAKLYIFLESNSAQFPLYEPAHFVVTENLLANKKGIEAGIPPSKMMYLPHHYQETDVERDETYLEEIAKKSGKRLKKSSKTVVIGMVTRLKVRKNCIVVFEAVEKLIEEGKDVLLVVRGEIEEKDRLAIQEKMDEYSQKQWFLWDREFTPLPEAYQKYRTFDVFVHLSGWEGASNVVAEILGLGIPCLILEGSTNPYLFHKGAVFVKKIEKDGFFEVRFHRPDEEDLYEKLKAFVDSPKLREEWGKRGKEIAKQRFHPSLTIKRLPLMLEMAKSNWNGKKERSLQDQVEKLYRDDCRLYGLEE